LMPHRKCESNGYLSAKCCEKASDFVSLIREALSSVIGSLEGNAEKAGLKKSAGPGSRRPNGKMVYLIFDNVDELSTALLPLFKKYCEPLGDLGAVPNEDMKRKLFGHLQRHIAPSLNEIFKVSSEPTSGGSLSKDNNKQKDTVKKLGESSDELDFHMSTSANYLLISAFLTSRNPATLDASLFDSTGGSDNLKRRESNFPNWLQFHFSLQIFSALCDSSEVTFLLFTFFFYLIKSSGKSLEKNETAEQELLIKGPRTFPLERLQAIFQCLTSVVEYSLDVEGQENTAKMGDSGDTGLMSHVARSLKFPHSKSNLFAASILGLLMLVNHENMIMGRRGGRQSAAPTEIVKIQKNPRKATDKSISVI
ncbi:hypothetical protein ACH5RR_024077, partial [Cinchona calisaya]